MTTRRLRALLLILGPGLISGFADNDAGGITTYSLVGAQYGYGLMWVVLASMLALGITQEAGARLGLATGHGLTSLVRERFGVRWTLFAVLTMLAANLGDTVAEFAGIAAALDLFGIPPVISAIVSATAVILLLARANFTRIQYVLLAVGAPVAAAYAVSAILARPDWGLAARSLVVPGSHLTVHTSWRSWERSARRSRRGARPSFSPIPRTKACAAATSGQRGST